MATANEVSPPGTLYLVPTPIGNPRDISLRAMDVLRSAGVVAAEDTRKTRTLLRALGIEADLLSYHDHNEDSRIPQLMDVLRAGQDVAVVADAGTPLVNDPGYRIVQAAIAAGMRVSPLPGPSAALTALIGSGLPSHQFGYVGFLPRKQAERRTVIGTLKALPGTLILFESPHRLLATLTDLHAVLGDRHAALARNLSKRDEEYIRGTLAAVTSEIAGRGEVRGEYTVVVAGAAKHEQTLDEDVTGKVAKALFRQGLDAGTVREVVKEVSGLPRNVVYQRVQEARQNSS